MLGQGVVEQITPSEAYETLREDPETALVDVRTAAEWAFVGLPDLDGAGRPLIMVEWVGFPAATLNPGFYEQIRTAFGATLPTTLFFICRSGARSLAAARMVAERSSKDGLRVRCVNVAEGFEGDVDADGHRGRVNGWKSAGLPWRQK